MTISLSFGDWLGIAGLIITLAIYYFDLTKKLDRIIQNQEGVMNRSQAQALTRLYLILVKSHLMEACNRYAKNSLKEDYESKNLEKIVRELHSIYTGVVEDKIRTMFSTFKLRDGRRFNEFAASVSRKNIENGFKTTEILFRDGMNQGKSLDTIFNILLQTIATISDQGSAMYMLSLDDIYRSTDE